MKHILVTGGAGYVGAVLVPKLLAKSYKVSVIDWYLYGDVFASYKTHPDLKEIKGDIRDVNLLKQALKTVDVVIHLACISNDPSFDANPVLGKSINYDATKILTDLALHSGVKVFIYASSSSVYGPKDDPEVTEDLPLSPLTGYSMYKALAEDYILDKNSHDFIVVILRPATICGYSPRLRLDLIVNMLTIQALVKKTITVFGSNQFRPNIHIQDITEIYLKLIEVDKEQIGGKVYNAGYKNYTLLEIASMIKQTLADKSIKIIPVPSVDTRSYKISSKKIKKELKFIPSFTVEEAIRDLQEAYSKGRIPDPLTNDRYYNIRTMRSYKESLDF